MATLSRLLSEALHFTISQARNLQHEVGSNFGSSASGTAAGRRHRPRTSEVRAIQCVTIVFTVL